MIKKIIQKILDCNTCYIMLRFIGETGRINGCNGEKHFRCLVCPHYVKED